jgi:hypothetical protein
MKASALNPIPLPEKETSNRMESAFQAWSSLDSCSRDELMFILLFEQSGLTEAIKLAESCKLQYSRALNAIRTGLGRGTLRGDYEAKIKEVDASR